MQIITGEYLLSFLTSALHGEWSTSLHGHFTPRENNHGYPLIWRLAGLLGQSGRLGDEKSLLPAQGIKLQIVQPVA